MTTGVDVNKDRLDDLDRKIISQSLEEPFEKSVVCNFGSGESSLSRALGSLGHRVYNYDDRDLAIYFDMMHEIGLRMHFTCINLSDITKHHLPKQLEIAVFQRVLHYLPYGQARRVLQLVAGRLTEGGKIYASLTGVDSAVGYSYGQKDTPIEERWGTLSEEEAEKFDIKQNVCLYREEEVRQLIDSVDRLKIEKIWTSEFGNIKVIVKTS